MRLPSTRMVAAFARERARADPRFRAEPHGRRRRRQSAVARRAGVGTGFGLRRLVRHRLGPGPPLPARQAAGSRSSATSTAPCWRPGSSSLKFDAAGGQLRGLGLRHAQAAGLPAALRSASSATSIRSWSGSATPSRACPNGGRRSAARAQELKAELAALVPRTDGCARRDRGCGRRGSTASRATSTAGAASTR